MGNCAVKPLNISFFLRFHPGQKGASKRLETPRNASKLSAWRLWVFEIFPFQLPIHPKFQFPSTFWAIHFMGVNLKPLWSEKRISVPYSWLYSCFLFVAVGSNQLQLDRFVASVRLCRLCQLCRLEMKAKLILRREPVQQLRWMKTSLRKSWLESWCGMVALSSETVALRCLPGPRTWKTSWNGQLLLLAK